MDGAQQHRDTDAPRAPRELHEQGELPIIDSATRVDVVPRPEVETSEAAVAALELELATIELQLDAIDAERDTVDPATVVPSMSSTS